MTWRSRALRLALIVVMAATPAAYAWTRPGHMVTAAIAYDEIAERRPDLLAKLAALLDVHPDRGAFQVAIDRTTGQERSRRMFLECARWPDDARETIYDHPRWHAALRPVVLDEDKTHFHPPDMIAGDAIEAFALNYRVLSDETAAPAERALALCWVLHLAGDIHQPLHAAQLFSKAYPEGDRGGGLQFVKDPLSGLPVSLHWLWDDSVHRSGEVAKVDARADELVAQFPRGALAELRLPASAAQFPLWAKEESYPLAVSLAFGARIPSHVAAESAPAVPERYWRDVQQASERRATVAGYRMADLVITALAPSAQ